MNSSRQTDPPPVTIGIDLGGTGTRLVAVDAAGVIRGQRMTATPHCATGDGRAVTGLIQQIHALADGAELMGVGIGASGPVGGDGVIRNDATLPAFSHLPLTDLVSAEFGVPCVIDNDAVTAAIGENAYGAGDNATSMLMVTLGTGIGVALLVNGEPVRAVDGTHPEGGHLPVPATSAPCYCGLTACWEQVASRTALDQLTCGRTAEIAARARDDDPVAEMVFDTYGSRVAAGLSILLPLIRPARLVLGGGAAQYLPLFAASLDASLRRAPGFDFDPVRRQAALGAVSGAVGAAVLARRTGRLTVSREINGVQV